MYTRIDPLELIDALRDYKGKYKMSQKDMAKKIGIPTFTLYRWEKGKARVSPMMYARLLDLGIVKAKKKG